MLHGSFLWRKHPWHFNGCFKHQFIVNHIAHYSPLFTINHPLTIVNPGEKYQAPVLDIADLRSNPKRHQNGGIKLGHSEFTDCICLWQSMDYIWWLDCDFLGWKIGDHSEFYMYNYTCMYIYICINVYIYTHNTYIYIYRGHCTVPSSVGRASKNLQAVMFRCGSTANETSQIWVSNRTWLVKLLHIRT